jgi:hypothetical protein
VGKLPKTRLTYLLDIKLYGKNYPNEHIAMVDIVRRWGRIIENIGRPECILAFLSHYFSKDVRSWLNNNKDILRFACSVKKSSIEKRKQFTRIFVNP